MLPTSFIDEVILKTDILDLIGSYSTLQHKGGSWVGLCPFHREKTPSFHVTPEKQMYYCFGCGAGGGAVQFVKAAENLSFIEAIEFLATRAGMTMPEDSNDVRQKQTDQLITIMRDAARWFHAQLSGPGSHTAVAYLQKRGLSPTMVKRFGVGFAPSGWDGLLRAMTALGHDKGQLLAAGLLVQNSKGGFYDKFRNRLMFPILDVRKRVIAFGGRSLDDTPPKYLNSPETLLFSKSRQLYALHEAKNTKSGRFVLTEGYLDTLALYQAGFDSAVASLGTALTGQHAALIARYVREAVVAYDSDEAGQKAAARAAPILQKAGLNVRILSLTGAKDPDEFIQRFGREAFAKLLDNAKSHADHALTSVQARHDLTADEGRVAYLQEAVETIVALSSPIEREIYTGRAAQVAGVSVDVVAAEIKKRLKQRQRKETRQLLQNPDGRTGPQRAQAKALTAEEDLLRILLLDSSMWAQLPPDLTADDFTDPFLKDIFARLHALGGQAGLAALDLSSEESGRLARLMQKPLSQAANRQALHDCVSTLQSQRALHTADGDEQLRIMMNQVRNKKGYGGNNDE